MKHVPKIEYFESLRGIAALVVMFHHANFIYGSPITSGFIQNHGHLMVDFFFVLSGWVIALNYAERLNDFRQVFIFQAKRLLRLYPLHILTLLVALAVEFAKYIAEQRLGSTFSYPAFSDNNLSSFIQNIFFLHVPLGGTHTWNFPSWSIAAEFQTYLIFALMVWLGGRFKYALVGVAMILALVFLLPHANDYNLTVGYEALVRCILSFLLGVLLQKLSTYFTISLPSLLDYFAVGTVIIAFSFASQIPGLAYPFIFGAALLMLSLTQSSIIKRMLELRALVFLGTISYGLYMWHVVVWFVLSNAAKIILKPDIVVGATDLGTYSDQMQVGLLTGLSIHALGLAIVILLSCLSYKFVEMPANNLRHKLRSTSR